LEQSLGNNIIGTKLEVQFEAEWEETKGLMDFEEIELEDSEVESARKAGTHSQLQVQALGLVTEYHNSIKELKPFVQLMTSVVICLLTNFSGRHLCWNLC
jgi:hypothetical protein